MKKSKLGGARPGSGRPKGEKKIALGLRVPEKHKKHLENLVREELNRLNVPQINNEH